MKRPVKWMVLLGLLCGSLSFGQAKVPAGLVDVLTNEFDAIDVSGSLYHSPTSRTYRTAQHVFDAIDDDLTILYAATVLDDSGWGYLSPTATSSQAAFDWLDANYGIVRTNWLFLNPTNLLFGVDGETTAKETFDWLDAWFSTNRTPEGTWAGMMPGTNIAGFTRTNLTWLPPFTNVVPRPGTNWSFEIAPTNLTGYLNYRLYDPDPALPASTNIVYDVKLNSTYSPMSAGTAAPFYGSYAALSQWTLTNSTGAAFAGVVAEKTDNTAFRTLTNGMFQATCGFTYGYGGAISGVGAKLQVGGVDQDEDVAASVSWGRPFSLSYGPVALASGAVVQVVFTTPDGGSLNYSTFKLYYLGP